MRDTAVTHHEPEGAYIVDLTNLAPTLIVYITERNGEYFARGTINGKWDNSIGRGTSKLDALEKYLGLLNDKSSWSEFQ